MSQKRVIILLILSLVISVNAFVQSFTDTIFPPKGWVRYNLPQDTNDYWTRVTTWYYDAPACARIWYDVPNNDWLITPRCLVEAGDSLIFYYRNNVWSSTKRETLNIRISTTNRDTSNFSAFNFVSPPTSNTSWWRAAFSLSAYAGQKIYIAFHYRISFKYGVSIDSIVGPTEVPVYDVATVSTRIYGPYIVGSPKSSKAAVKNVGYLTPPASFMVTATVIDPNPPYWLNFQGVSALFVDSSRAVNFGPWTPDTDGIHTFKAFCTLFGDSNQTNDTISRQIEVAPSFYTAPYRQNFNSRLWNILGETPCGWTILANGSSDTNELHWNTNDWHRYAFPGGDTIAQVKAELEDTSYERLISPKINCSVPGEYFLNFWMHYYAGNPSLPESGMVLISNDGGGNWNEVAKYKNTPQPAGNRVFNVTSLVSGFPDVRVMFRYFSVHDGYWQIDNFFLGTLGIPTLLAPANDTLINDRTPTFHWSDVGAAEKYELQVSDNTLFSPRIIDDTIIGSITFTPTVSITPDDTFYWRIRAGIDTLWASWSNVYRFYLDATPPALCTLWTPANGETLSITTPTFQWSKITDAVKFRIQISTDFFFNTLEVDSFTDDAIYTAQPLASGFQYWRVLAVDAAQNTSAWTVPWVFYNGNGAPGQWQPMAEIPTTSPSASGKAPKIGSSSAVLNGKIYFLNASGTQDFYCYTPDSSIGSWAVLESFPIGNQTDGDGKKPKKGAAITALNYTVYALRGSNTVGFWKYVTDAAPPGESLGWHKLQNIPEGIKKPKDGSALVPVILGSRNGIFTMKGSKTDEFYIYDILANTWTPTPKPPAGTKIGYKSGSCLAFDGDSLVYVLKGSYGDFFKYNLTNNTWSELRRYNYKLFPNRANKKKKPKDGASIVYFKGNVYMLKGGNTLEFWRYEVASDSWIQMPEAWDIPSGSGKKVKGGGTLCVLDENFYVSKGNNTNEFYRHGRPLVLENKITSSTTAQPGKMANGILFTDFELSIVPNPAINKTTVRYNLPKAGPVNFKLYNVSGALVKSYTNANSTRNAELTIDLKILPAGIYIMKFKSGDVKITRKLVLKK